MTIDTLLSLVLLVFLILTVKLNIISQVRSMIFILLVNYAKLPMKVAHTILYYSYGVGVYIHEYSHYVVSYCAQLSPSKPVISNWKYGEQSLASPSSSYVRTQYEYNTITFKVSFIERLCIICCKLAPLLVPLYMVVLFPFWFNAIVHWLTSGGLVPSSSDWRGAFNTILSSDVRVITKGNNDLTPSANDNTDNSLDQLFKYI